MLRTDWLARLRDELTEQLQVELPEPPALGSFDPDEVRRADYFCS
jgi:hypothetical protein